MPSLYITDSTAKVGFRENRIVVTFEDTEQGYPIETIDTVTIFGLPHVSMKLMSELLRRKIDLLFYSTDGHYFGRFANPDNVNTARQKAQAYLSSDPDFRLVMARGFIGGKIKNSIDLLQAHDTESCLTESDFRGMRHSLEWLARADTVEELIGFEGNAAKAYFEALSKLVPPEFAFSGRSKRPPRDSFNSMISFGYSMLYRHVIGAVERHGLNPYFGFMHADKEGHATLVSDLMEEWRAIIVDETVLALIGQRALTPELFTQDPDTGGVFIGRDAMRTLTRALGEKFKQTQRYIADDDYHYGFQYALDLQIVSLVNAIEAHDPTLYRPVTQRDESAGAT
ncbi:MAG: CRISPR-associated endonuclease Cas1 [Actinomycetes bacterium]|jgi:CRISPR-associated protein Cas1|nr:CRISPR-associated endonuclease Cas1 [Actinomycetes bacterium]